MEITHGWKRTGIALVCVLAQVVAALGNVQVLSGDNLVESVGGAGELLAGVAVAIEVSLLSLPDVCPMPCNRGHDDRTYQRICDCWSCSSLAVHSVLPQWQ